MTAGEKFWSVVAWIALAAWIIGAQLQLLAHCSRQSDTPAAAPASREADHGDRN